VLAAGGTRAPRWRIGDNSMAADTDRSAGFYVTVSGLGPVPYEV
jgi:hypothetical protein